MSEKTVAQKAHVKPGTTIAVINGVPAVVESLGLPNDARYVRPTAAQLVLLFVHTRAELEAEMPSAVEKLSPSSVLWVFFRKGSTEAGRDMSRNTVWATAESLGLRPLGLIAVDDRWSVFRLRPGGAAADARSTASKQSRRTR